jgi:hypothetical protein
LIVYQVAGHAYVYGANHSAFCDKYTKNILSAAMDNLLPSDCGFHGAGEKTMRQTRQSL